MSYTLLHLKHYQGGLEIRDYNSSRDKTQVELDDTRAQLCFKAAVTDWCLA